MTEVADETVFDFIVVGAGSAGCAVAARLSESGRHNVLLLEAGPQDSHPLIHIPLGFSKLLSNERLIWKFKSEPVSTLDNRVLYEPRGKVLGGTSSINGMVYIRGVPADYDAWYQSGLEGWDWESVLPYFKKAEDNERGSDNWHGIDGPLRISDISHRAELPTAMIAAALEAGIPANSDFNGPVQEGVGFYQFTASKNRRFSSAKAYLAPARKRQNLHVETSAQARRILIENKRAVGVEYQSPHGVRRVRARREVIVSCGTFCSPQLLQLSGVGPGDLLHKMNIAIQHELPAVGANLRDHFSTYMGFRCAQKVTLNDLALSLPRQLIAGVQYLLTRSGPLSNSGVSAGAFVRSDPAYEHPDIQINMASGSVKSRTCDRVITHPFSAFSFSLVHLHPDCDGSVRIKDPDPLVAPTISFEFLRNDEDGMAIVRSMEICRQIAHQPALEKFMVEEILPGSKVSTDQDLLADVRARGIGNYHSVGTCRMGVNADSVTDCRLRVHGVDGLRVADASVMPTVISGNTNAPAIMIGEKAAAMILQDLSLSNRR
jgi:choline dehydrogenase